MKDPLGISGQLNEVTSIEILVSLNKKTFKVVVLQEIEDSDNVLGGHFVLAIKKSSLIRNF